MRPFVGQASLRRRAAFTVLEILVVVGILGVLSSVIIASGTKSLQRSKINAVAVELAGWLTAIRAKNENGCYVDYVGTSNKSNSVRNWQINPTGLFSSGAQVLTFRTPADCSDPSGAQDGFRLPANVGGGYRLRLFDPIIFSPRGTTAMANNATNETDYIRIFHAGSGLLRCIRIRYWTGIIEIGSNSKATTIADPCTSFDRF
jgi:type II secretory pathway pseudopilin PulG